MSNPMEVFVAIGKRNNEFRKYGYCQVEQEARLNPNHPKHTKTMRELAQLVLLAEEESGFETPEAIWSYTYEPTEEGVEVTDRNQHIVDIDY